MAELRAHNPDNGLATVDVTVKGADGSDQPGRMLAAISLDLTGRSSGEIVGLNVVIPSGQSLSPWIDLGGALLGGVVLPSGWGTTNAANLGFRRAQLLDGTGEALLFDAAGQRIMVRPGASALTEARAYALAPADFWHSRFFRLAALNQSTGALITVTADRTVRLLARVP